MGISALKATMLADAIGADDGTATYVLDTSQAKLGYIPLSRSNTFLLSLLTDGPYLIIGPAARTQDDNQSGVGEFDVESRVWLGMDRESVNDLSTVENFLEALRDAWSSHDTTWIYTMDTARDPITIEATLRTLVKSC